MTDSTIQFLPSLGSFRYRIGDVVYEQRWQVNGNGLEMADPIEIEISKIERPKLKLAPRLDCIHRGSQVAERQCPSCDGNVTLKIFGCEIYQQATIARQVDDLACCATCLDYEKDQDNANRP